MAGWSVARAATLPTNNSGSCPHSAPRRVLPSAMVGSPPSPELRGGPTDPARRGRPATALPAEEAPPRRGGPCRAPAPGPRVPGPARAHDPVPRRYPGPRPRRRPSPGSAAGPRTPPPGPCRPRPGETRRRTPPQARTLLPARTWRSRTRRRAPPRRAVGRGAGSFSACPEELTPKLAILLRPRLLPVPRTPASRWPPGGGRALAGGPAVSGAAGGRTRPA